MDDDEFQSISSKAEDGWEEDILDEAPEQFTFGLYSTITISPIHVPSWLLILVECSCFQHVLMGPVHLNQGWGQGGLEYMEECSNEVSEYGLERNDSSCGSCHPLSNILRFLKLRSVHFYILNLLRVLWNQAANSARTVTNADPMVYKYSRPASYLGD